MMVPAFAYAVVDPNQSIAVSMCFGLTLRRGIILGSVTLVLTGGSERKKAQLQKPNPAQKRQRFASP